VADTYEYVLNLAHQYNPEDVGHMEQDARLATQIFRLTRRLHELPQEYEELLEYAALLHDIGYVYGYEAHHKHAYDLIMAADLPGLTEREKAIVANVARYHRGALPRLNHQGFAALTEEDREIVTRLGAILRLADGLDRSHTDAVEDLECEIIGGHVIFTLHPPHGNEMERWAGLKKSRFFQEVFDVTVELR
jgi:exopolyphosphatase/guanosine-5'-triphosphate,3'-diphosphate pyrophosphatase